MSKTKVKAKTSKVNFGKHLRVLILMALFAAISVVMKLYAFPREGIIRISFENLPIMFTSIFLGPIQGMVVAIVADLLGCLAIMQTPLPMVTVGAAFIGLFSGLLYRWLKLLPPFLRIGIAVVTVQFIGSILIKSYAIHDFYKLTYLHAIIWRTYYFAIAAAEWGMLYSIYKSPVSRALNKMFGRTTPPKRKQRK